MASKFDHCLADLIYRWRIGKLPMEVVGVVSNWEEWLEALLISLEVHHYFDFLVASLLRFAQ